jgi:subtilisin family serine protease
MTAFRKWTVTLISLATIGTLGGYAAQRLHRSPQRSTPIPKNSPATDAQTNTSPPVAATKPTTRPPVSFDGSPTELRPGTSVYYDANAKRIVRMRSGELVVAARATATREGIDALARSAGFAITADLPNHTYLVRGSNEKLPAARKQFEADARVRYAEPNFLARVAGLPTKDPFQETQAGLKQIRAERAWSVSTGQGVTIAILDTGVDVEHEDLRDNVVPGVDLVNNDDDPEDDNGHGTACAGIAAARANNAVGIAGVAPDAHIMPVKVLDEHGWGTYVDLAEGIRWASEHGARVISISAGSYAASRSLAEAVAQARAAGALVVASVGNDGTSAPMYPATMPGVLGVGALTETNAAADYSNTGIAVDVVAPGDSITSTLPGNRYKSVGGTSIAAAFASGVAALAMSSPNNQGAGDIEALLRSSADSMGTANEKDRYGAGQINAARAVGLDNNDVAVSFAELQPTNPALGEPTKLRIGVQNKMPRETRVTAWFEVDGAATNESKTLTVGAQSNIVAELPIALSKLGEHRVRVRLQSEGDEQPENDARLLVTSLVARSDVLRDVGVERIYLSPVSDRRPMQIGVVLRNLGNVDMPNLEVACKAGPQQADEFGQSEPVGPVTEVGRASARVPVGKQVTLEIPWTTVVLGHLSQQVSCAITSPDDIPANDRHSADFAISRVGEVRALYGGKTHEHVFSQALALMNQKRGGTAKGLALAAGSKTPGSVLGALNSGTDAEDNTFDTEANSSFPHGIDWRGNKYVTVMSSVPVCTMVVCGAFDIGSGLLGIPPICLFHQTVACAAGTNHCVCDYVKQATYVQTMDHFWDPDDDQDGRKDCSYTLPIGSGVKSAAQKVRIHMENAAQYFDAARTYSGLPRASAMYMAYHYLGRVSHLLADMTVPTHVHNDCHPKDVWLLGDLDYDTFENVFLDEKTHYDDPQYIVTPGWPENVPNRWLVVPSDAWKERNMARRDALDYLMFSNAEASQFFASNHVNGENTIPGKYSFFTSSIFPSWTFPSVANDAEDYSLLSVAPNVIPLAITSTVSLWDLIERDFIKPYDRDLDGIVDASDHCPDDFDPNNSWICIAKLDAIHAALR